MKRNKTSFKNAVNIAKKKGYVLTNKIQYPSLRWPDGKKYYAGSATNNKPGKFFTSIDQVIQWLNQPESHQVADRITRPDLYHSTNILSPFDC